MAKRKENAQPARARKPSSRKSKAPPGVPFVARFHENTRAGLKCSCTFSKTCDGSGLVACAGDADTSGPHCECQACPLDIGEHLNACPGCENCRASVCAGCGKRDPSVPAVEGESWTCSPECTRKTFTVAS